MINRRKGCWMMMTMFSFDRRRIRSLISLSDEEDFNCYIRTSHPRCEDFKTIKSRIEIILYFIAYNVKCASYRYEQYKYFC